MPLLCVEEEGEDFVGTLHQQVMRLGGSGDWTVEMLIGWLDRRIDHADIPAGESAVFLRKAILGLMASFGIEDVTKLALDRFRLRDQVEMRIQRHREEERDFSFQQWLLPGSALVVSESKAIHFAEIRDELGWNYEGATGEVGYFEAVETDAIWMRRRRMGSCIGFGGF